MDERHSGFAETPFGLAPDSRHVFPTPGIRELSGRLHADVRARAAVLLLTGPEGAGKTTFLRYFLSQSGPDVRAAHVPWPVLTSGELLHGILQDLGVPFTGGTSREAVETLVRALREAREAGLRVMVVIDEAHRLPPRVFDQLRSLSALKSDGQPLLTLVLVGEPGLAAFFEGAASRPDAPTPAARYRLEPLSVADLGAAVKHRLLAAGGLGTEFDQAAVARAHALSAGVPGAAFDLCNRALSEAAQRGLTRVDVSAVDAAARESRQSEPSVATGGRSALRSRAALVLILLLAGLALAGLRSCVRASRSADDAASSGTPFAFEPTPLPVDALPGPFPDVRCAETPSPRSVAIEAIGGFLGTPGFDSAPVRVTFEQWRALGLPAIATFRTPGGSCEAAVMPIDEDKSRVSDATGSYVMENARLKSVFLGAAIICFVDRDFVLARPERARFAWARGILEGKGLVRRGAPEASVREALARVAAEVGQRQTASVEGALLAALYALAGPPAPEQSPAATPSPR